MTESGTDRYLVAARECRNDPLPANWEWVGKRHLSRLCGCSFPDATAPEDTP
jgi:hypothetical protein